MNKIDDIEEQINTGKWAYTIIDKEIYFKYLGNKDKTNLGYSLHFDWAEPESKLIKDKHSYLKSAILGLLVGFLIICLSPIIAIIIIFAGFLGEIKEDAE